MKNLHQVKQEKPEDAIESMWKKFSSLSTATNTLSGTFTNTNSLFTNFRDYYVNYPVASGIPYTGSLYIDGQYVGQGTGEVNIPADNQYHHFNYTMTYDEVERRDEVERSYNEVVLNDNPVRYWRLGEPDGSV